MARSLKEAQQELERLQSMSRSMPNEKDEAAVELSRKIESLKAEIAKFEAGGAPTKKKKKKGGVPWPVLLLIAVALGGAAFGLAFFGGQLATP